MKLGICCVYFYGPDSRWLLDLQLRYIASTLEGYEYTIYAAANRLEPDLGQLLVGAPHVKVVSLSRFEGEGSLEHAFYLDLLLREAADDGCTHLVTLDADSFPVLPDWPKVLLTRMGRLRFAAVLRSENFDTYLPHPCGMFMEAAFLLEHRPRMLPGKSEILGSPSFQQFLKKTGQRTDTGIGYGYVLWESQEAWLALKRSNSMNLHFLMAGIYGDVFFHLGASARRPWFYGDYRRKLSLKIGRAISMIPVIWRFGSWLEERYVASNRRTFGRIANRLRNSPDVFLASLQRR